MGKTWMPPGFRFHPTDVELVWYYLKRKVMGKPFQFEAIAEVELYKFAPWELTEKSILQSRDLEWYFFCPRDRKYSTGCRTNRATETGYWKTTGRDRPIIHKSQTVGMKKTLIFHLGKTPQGDRTDWVMYEFRLESKDLVNAGNTQDTFVLCKIFQKSGAGPKSGEQYGAPFKEEDWDDDDIEDSGSFQIVSSTENPHQFPPFPPQYVAHEAGEPSSNHLIGAPSYIPSNFEVGGPSYVPSNFEVGGPSYVQELSETANWPPMQGLCGSVEPSSMPEPYTDKMSVEQLEAFLLDSPLPPDPVSCMRFDSAISVHDFIQLPDLGADHVNVPHQPLPEPADGTVSYNSVCPDVALHPAFEEFAKNNYMELTDMTVADREDPVESVAPDEPQCELNNVNPNGPDEDMYADDVLDAYLSSDLYWSEFANNQFSSTDGDKSFADGASYWR